MTQQGRMIEFLNKEYGTFNFKFSLIPECTHVQIEGNSKDFKSTNLYCLFNIMTDEVEDLEVSFYGFISDDEMAFDREESYSDDEFDIMVKDVEDWHERYDLG